MPSWSGPYGIAFTIHNSLFTIHPSIIRGAIIPFEPITLVLILGAAISGTTEALVGKSAEAGPGEQFLHCIVNDAVGGESVLVDALTVAETLRDRHPDHFEILARTPVRYTSVSDTWWIVNRGPVIEVDGDGEVIGTRIHPALLGPVDVEPEHIDAWYRAHDELVRLAVRPEMQFTFRLQAGQCQIFDNRRILHSRRHFDPSTGDRVLEGCYVTLDDFTSRMHTLRRQGADFRHR